jgi:tripartite ATP-independent transporter DctP family solute receptor
MQRLTGSTIGVLLGFALGGGAQAQQALKLGHVYETEHPMHTAALDAAEQVKACTGGEITLEVYPASQLGKETALNEQIRFGGVDIIFTGQNFAAGAYPALAIGAAPYIFKDRDQALRYRTSDVFKELWQGWDEATGQHILSAAYFGAFNVSSNDPIVDPADMQGMKVRVPDAPLYMAFPEAVGANPTPVAFAEVYLALQQGVVSASVNPLPVTYAKKFYEVQEYVALTNHLIEYVLWVVGDHVWSGLSEDQQGCLQEAADDFGERASALVVEQEDSLRDKMTAEGKIQFTDPDVDAFIKATEGARQRLVGELDVPEGVVERIKGL